MPREYLLLPFSSWLRGLCSSWALLGHCVAPAACSAPHSSEQSDTGGLCFQPCRNMMIPGAVQCIYHTDNAPAQTEGRRGAYLTPSRISAAELPVPEVTAAGQAFPAQAENSQCCSHRQGQRISCPPVKARSLCDRTRKRMRGLIPGGWGGKQL